MPHNMWTPLNIPLQIKILSRDNQKIYAIAKNNKLPYKQLKATAVSPCTHALAFTGPVKSLRVKPVSVWVSARTMTPGRRYGHQIHSDTCMYLISDTHSTFWSSSFWPQTDVSEKRLFIHSEHWVTVQYTKWSIWVVMILYPEKFRNGIMITSIPITMKIFLTIILSGNTSNQLTTFF